jgi:hypothetical protein
MLNLNKLPQENIKNLQMFHTIYCYPERMFLSQDLLIRFEQCLKQKQITWFDLLATVTIDNSMHFATISVSIATANLILLFFRLVVDLDVW